MGKGISVFTGMEFSLRENLQYIENAKKLGFNNIFTSLHIPEANYEEVVEEFKCISKLAHNLHMNLTADISPRTFKYLAGDNYNLKVLKNLGVCVIRLDFGFTPTQISQFTRNIYGLIIEINASTVTEKFLREIEKFNPDFSKLRACHNYYPRLNTGISIDTFIKKNNLLKKYNMKIGAFIPSLKNKRGPIFEGLPTLEIHRNMEPEISAKHLFAMGIDDVILGDCICPYSDLKKISGISEDVIEFNVHKFNPSKIENTIIFGGIHKNRIDEPEDVVRSTASRETIKNKCVIEPHDNFERKIGYITIDNKNYLRYAGELQICKKHLPADDRVNVVARIADKEIFLLKYVDVETKFHFNLCDKNTG